MAINIMQYSNTIHNTVYCSPLAGALDNNSLLFKQKNLITYTPMHTPRARTHTHVICACIHWEIFVLSENFQQMHLKSTIQLRKF